MYSGADPQVVAREDEWRAEVERRRREDRCGDGAEEM